MIEEKITPIVKVRRDHLDYLKQVIEELEMENERLYKKIMYLENRVNEQRNKLEVAYNAIKDF